MTEMPESVRGLLTAVFDAISIPYPAAVGDTEQHDRVLNDRVMHATIALRSVLDEEPITEIEWTTAYLRKQLAAHPPTGYRAWGEAP